MFTAQKLAIYLLAIIALPLSSTSPATAAKPNIVLIMADDMGYECVAANGGTSYETPRLDKMAEGGMRFLNCHSQPICTPSRVQIMTGIYNNRNYIRFGLLDPRAKTFAHVLKKAGYSTCVVGKWQLQGGLDGPKHFGFDEYCLWQVNRRPGRYTNPGLEINGKQVDYNDGQFGPDIVSDYLCDFIERHKDRPFLAYYPMILPHWPFVPTPDSEDYDKSAKGQDGIAEKKYFPGMVSYVDKIVGKITDKLDALAIRENTVVIFTGDNGTYKGVTSLLDGRAIQGGKGITKDNGTHVPMIASWPGTLRPGQVTDALIDFSDILPTLAELSGAKVPGGLQLRGTSFAPLLQGKPFEGRPFIYCWYERNGRRGKESQHSRDARFKLYHDGRFHDVVDDFAEKTPLDVATLEGGAKTAYDKLKKALDEEMAINEKATEVLRKRGVFKKKKKK